VSGRLPAPRRRKRPSRIHQEPEAVTWARQKSGLTKRALADLVGISEQLMGEIESGWRNATPANLAKIAEALNCPLVVLERKRSRKPPEERGRLFPETAPVARVPRRGGRGPFAPAQRFRGTSGLDRRCHL
jgi:transcriptional regulator with XRE-family HTH domain